VKLIWSSRALRDLYHIGDHIAKDNPSAARRHVDKLVKRMHRVKRFPNSGRAVPEVANDAIREIVEGHYRVVYIIDPILKTLTVLTVFESHKQLRI
jgi:toxin ParE1/3/4